MGNDYYFTGYQRNWEVTFLIYFLIRLSIRYFAYLQVICSKGKLPCS